MKQDSRMGRGTSARFADPQMNSQTTTVSHRRPIDSLTARMSGTAKVDMDETCDGQHLTTSDPSLIAQFIIETHTFRTFYYTEEENSTLSFKQEPREIQAYIKSATTTRGRSLIIPGCCDSTGIMIWPASYLLCQYLCYTQSMKIESSVLPQSYDNYSLGSTILELGCGCGILSVTTALTMKACRPKDSMTLFCTDVDEDAIRLCSENIQRNNLGSCRNDSTNLFIAARTLSWGNETDMNTISDEAGVEKFDSVIAADIVYPTTTDEILSLLFQTVDQMLRKEGSFLLSFVSRDGYKTPSRFIQVASKANYRIDFIPYHDFIPLEWTNFLPPLLDATLLILTRDENAHVFNNQLGSDDCLIFPGLKRVSQSSSNNSCDENEEWMAPECFED